MLSVKMLPHQSHGLPAEPFYVYAAAPACGVVLKDRFWCVLRLVGQHRHPRQGKSQVVHQLLACPIGRGQLAP